MPRSVLERAVELPEDSWFVRGDRPVRQRPRRPGHDEIDATAYLAAKRAAMRAHETQITVDGDYFALSNEVGQRIGATEYYTQLAGPRARPRPGRAATRDLFAR